MTNIVIEENGKIRNIADVELAEDIVEMRKKKDPWEVIDRLVKVWATNAPEDVEAIRINVEEYREIQEDKEYGRTKNGKDFERRFQLAFPVGLQGMIRTQYKAEELPFSRDFFRKFGKRFPFFKVAQKD